MSDKLEERALLNAKQGQELTNAWHSRMAEIDSRLPPRTVPKDDPKRGDASPLGGVGWFKGFK